MKNISTSPIHSLKYICILILLTFALSPSVYSSPKAMNKQDFTVKGFHIDLRCEVMTMPALKNFAKELAGFGINTIIMEWEGSFPYDKHATISSKYAYTREEVKSFITYCTSLGIDVIPLQNCFSHSEYILRHDRYAHLREDRKEVSQVCPLKINECKPIFTEIFKDMAELHPSRYFHIGCDETYLLGSCKACAEKVQKEGKSKLFVDYVKAMCEIVKSMGKQPVLWADIILKYPEALNELPKDIIYVDWNYGWDRNHFGNLDNLFNAGVTFWGAPSIRSHPDNIYLTQWEKHFNNQKTFIPYARQAGYQGMVMTSWSTSGTYGFSYDTGWEVIEMFPVRYVYPLSGFRILVAAYGESLKNNTPIDPQRFVVKYGQERFGLTPQESEILWQALKTPQETVTRGKDPKGKPVQEMKTDAIAVQRQLSALQPKKNNTEFEHLRLMNDIRVQYLSFKEIENRYQSDRFERGSAKTFLKELEPLIREAKMLDKRFLTLNKGFLHDEEIAEINRTRNEKLYTMYETLNRIVN